MPAVAEPVEFCERSVARGCARVNDADGRAIGHVTTCPLLVCAEVLAGGNAESWGVCAALIVSACAGSEGVPTVLDPLDPSGCENNGDAVCATIRSGGSEAQADARVCVVVCDYVVARANPSRTSCGPAQGVGQACAYYSEVGPADSGVCKYDPVVMPGSYHCVGTATVPDVERAKA